MQRKVCPCIYHWLVGLTSFHRLPSSCLTWEFNQRVGFVSFLASILQIQFNTRHKYQILLRCNSNDGIFSHGPTSSVSPTPRKFYSERTTAESKLQQQHDDPVPTKWVRLNVHSKRSWPSSNKRQQPKHVQSPKVLRSWEWYWQQFPLRRLRNLFWNVTLQSESGHRVSERAKGKKGTRLCSIIPPLGCV